MSSQDFTTTLLFLFYHGPSRLHLGNPTLHVEPGFYYFLVLYYFSTVLFHDLLFHYLLLCYLLLYYSTTTPAVCISETQPDMSSQDVTMFLFQYCAVPLFTSVLFTTLLFTFILFYHDPSRLHLGNQALHVQPGFYYSTMLLFYYFSTVLFHDLLCYVTIYFLSICPRKPNLAC